MREREREMEIGREMEIEKERGKILEEKNTQIEGK